MFVCSKYLYIYKHRGVTAFVFVRPSVVLCVRHIVQANPCSRVAAGCNLLGE